MFHVRIFTDSVSFTDISHFGVEGMRVTPTRGWLYQPCDVAIMYGLANPERGSLQGQLRNAIYREHKGPIVVVESSLLGRGFKPAMPRWLAAMRRRPARPRQVHPYFRVAIGGALGDDADFCAANSPADRWEFQQRELGIKLAPYRREGRHIVILGQVGRDASLRGLDIARWIGDTARAVRERTDRPILVRLHPSTRWRDRVAAIAACDGVADLTISPPDTLFSSDIRDAWTCVTYSSGGAVDALLAGVPPICLSPASLAYALCSQSLDDLEAPLEPEREQFLRDLAYSQWTRAEIADGTVWRHLLPAITRELDASVTARAAQKSPDATLPAGKRRWLKLQLGACTFALRSLPRSPRFLRGRADALLRLGHLVEAKTTFETLRQRQPDMTSGHRGVARTAERLRQFDEALAAWTALSRLSPQQAGPLSGIGRLAMRLGRLDEAETAFGELLALEPGRKEALLGLERIANERGEWVRVLELQQQMLRQDRDLDMTLRHALLLESLHRFDELGRFVDELATGADPLPYLIAATVQQSAQHDWQGTVDLLAHHQPLVIANWQLCRTLVTALRRLGRMDEALQLLDSARCGSDTQRASRRIECLIDMQRHAEADRMLQAAWQANTLEAISVAYLAAMLTAAQELGGLPLARSVLADLQPSASRSGRALRVNKLFHGWRLDSCDALAEGRLTSPSPSPEQQILAALGEDATVPPDLVDQCRMLAAHRAEHADAHFAEASVVLADALEVAYRIVEAADAGRPFSLLRLGDGEGALLPYRAELAEFRTTDLASNGRTWWGTRDLPPASVTGEFEAAIRAADVVGIADLERLVRIFYQTERTAHLANGRHLRGLLATTDFAAANCQAAVWTTCHIHQSLAFWGLWDIILPRLADLDLITCHGQLGDILSRQHGIRIGHVHRIPPERKYAAGFADSLGEAHFPTAFERLRDTLPATSKGRTVLVSAGALGKIYCDWIKQAGGVAIDIGSAADYWCGYGTRGMAEVAMYRTPTGTAEMVRAVIAAHPRYRTLLVRPDVAPRAAAIRA